MSKFGDLIAGVSGETVATPVVEEAPVVVETPVVDTTPSSVEEPPRPEEEVADAVSAEKKFN